jgi:hypothetical protein
MIRHFSTFLKSWSNGLDSVPVHPRVLPVSDNRLYRRLWSVRQINRMLERRKNRQRGEDPPTPPPHKLQEFGNLAKLLQV